MNEASYTLVECNLRGFKGTVDVEPIKSLGVSTFFNNCCGVDDGVHIFKGVLEISIAENTATDCAVKLRLVRCVKVEPRYTVPESMKNLRDVPANEPVTTCDGYMHAQTPKLKEKQGTPTMSSGCWH